MSDGRVRLPLPTLPKRWWLSRGRLWVGILLVTTVQLGAILWLGERQPAPPRQPSAAPALRMLGSARAELLQLLDPTLFALPHEQGFSGAGWLIPEVQVIQPFTWSEPSRWLELSVARLGTEFSESVATNGFEARPILARPESGLLLPQLVDAPSFPQRSTARLEQGLASRRMVTALELPSWANTDLVSNSVVQLVVDAQGLPFSVTLLERSGLADADKYALEEARKARFEPQEGAGPAADGLTWGTLVFEWHTVPALANVAPPVRNP